MPSVDRDASRDSERRLKHQHSASSDHAKAVVPMWDSSDPDRAPPPLPLNPASSPNISSRPNTSAAIHSAHAALTEKAREAFLANPSSPPKRIESPERSLIKGAAHRRMQSLQTGNVRDLSNFLEGGSLTASPTRSPEKISNRPSTPYAGKEFVLVDPKSPDKETNRSSTPTPTKTPAGKDTPTLRPSLRRLPQSILGENTPPHSATMLALQSMPTRDSESPLSNVTNGSSALVRTPQTFDAISNQILSLTSIATSLQREMAQLSRRSKDNATDLVSLKEATNARDEDIRRSLRELVNNLSEASSRSSSNIYDSRGFMLDNKPHTPSSRSLKTISLPRIPSPNSFSASLDRESTASPMPSYNSDGTVSIALLEKIIREMGTKQGQDTLIERLTEVADRLVGDGATTAKSLEELLRFVKSNSGAAALVYHNRDGNGYTTSSRSSSDEPPTMELEFQQHRPGPMVARVENLLGSAGNKENRRESGNTRAADLINEDILKIIRSVKDSVAQGGGLTAEVKALVRELRGEVLGMGREIGRKLDQSGHKSNVAEKEHVARVVQDGLEELKQHMDRVMRDARRQSSATTVSRTTADGHEVYNAVKAAMTDMQAAQQLPRNPGEPALRKDDIIEAVREACENYKPDIELQHFGLEREELLACLKEGIQEYVPQDIARDIDVATREEVFQAVVEGLKHFSFPRVETEASLSREEVIDAVRECLEEFEFPSAPSAIPTDVNITREDVLDAVKEGLQSFDLSVLSTGSNRAIDDSENVDGYGEQILERLQEIIHSMRIEFKAVSDEAKQNVAANGRDTEQVLDATKDGFEKLRSDIESYVDRAADVTGKDEILDSLRGHFDSLRESMSTSLVVGPIGTDKDEILDALKEGLESVRADIERPRGSNESVLSGTEEILDAFHDGLAGLRADVEKINNKPVDMTINYEILDTLKAGLDSVRSDIDHLKDSGFGEREIAAITNGAVVTAEGLKRNDIEQLEVLITQLRIKVEALESMPPPPQQPVPGALSREDLAGIEEILRNVQASVGDMSGRNRCIDEESVRKEDVVAIETLLRNTKAKIDDIDLEQAVKKDDINVLEGIIRQTHDTVNSLATDLGTPSTLEGVNGIEILLKEIILELAEVKDHVATEDGDGEKVAKTDIEAVEAVCLDMKIQIDKMVSSDLPSKDDVKNIEEIVKELAETSSKAFEERQAETVGVGERVTEVKLFLEEFKGAIKEKLDEGSTGIEALGKSLETLAETINQNANVSEGVSHLFKTMKAEFEISNAGVVGAKLDSDEKFQKTWDKFDSKMEEKFNELMVKYDDAQIAAATKERAGEQKSAETEAAMLSTKAVAEELKIIVDTLGNTLTESVEKMDEASKTVFNRVDDTFARVDEIYIDAKAEHRLTREQASKSLNAIEIVRGHVTEYHPKILETIKDVLVIVGKHYEHSRASIDIIKEKIAERVTASPHMDQALLNDIPVTEKYDDTEVHEKLNKIVDHMHAAGKSFAQLDRLDQIHQKVMHTAAEVSEFVSAQTQRIADEYENKEKAVEAATITLEKRLAQKERVEAEVVSLHEEQERLKESVAKLKAEEEVLAYQKTRLSADVSSLETAIRIRREELHAMEARAEGLERRILEGVIDHSRALLVSKSNKGRDAMNLKRVPSHATSSTGSAMSSSTLRSRSSYATQSAVSLAMGGNRAINVPFNNSAGASRRILSLGQITHNVQTGGFKRSHSVKNPGGSGSLRKTSWGGSLSQKEYGDLNKENLALKEGEEDSDDVSDSDTMRRTSRGTASGYGTTEVVERIEEGMEYSETDGDLETMQDERTHVMVFDEAGEGV